MANKSFLGRLRESFIPSNQAVKDGEAVLGVVEQSFGVRLNTSLTEQVAVFHEDPVVKESILQFAQQVISTGIFITGDKYDVKLPIPDKYNKKYSSLLTSNESWDAKGCIEFFNRANNMDDKLLTVAIEMDAFGNSFWNIVEGFDYVPIQSVMWAKPNAQEVSTRDQYDLQLSGVYRGMPTLTWGEFIHFKTDMVGTAPFGTGIIYALIQTPKMSGIPSFYEMRLGMRAAMLGGFRKFSFGNELWTFEGLSDKKVTEVGQKITQMDPTGQRIATNVKGDIHIAVPQRTTSYDQWLMQMQDEFLMSLANPSLKLGLERGYTKATAQAAQELFNSKIESMRREIKRPVEQLYSDFLLENGFDPQKANIKLNFGSEQIEYVAADIFKAAAMGIISPDEARTILRNNMRWEITDATAPKETPQQIQNNELKLKSTPSGVDPGIGNVGANS
jgi:hypothetical protein